MSGSTNSKNRKTSSLPKKSLVFEDDDDNHHNLASTTEANDSLVSTSTAAVQSSYPAKKRKRGEEPATATLDAFASPIKKKTTAVAVTPEESERKALAKYVPKYIHKNLDYKREGESTQNLSPTTRNVYRLVCENYQIPQDFEQRRAYGPLSGMSYEERVIQGYALGKLVAKVDDVDICTCCASVGHKRSECPSLV